MMAKRIPQSFLLLVLILPYLPTSRAPQISVIGNTDALTTEFAPEDYGSTDMILSIATPMSSNPERIFSLTGLLLTASRARLQSDIIGASMALGSWDREGVINMVDGQLKRQAKEETILTGGEVSQHHIKTRDRPILRAGRQEGQ
ncbi:uncharacterized protein K441DRAFT_251192 [Cenococcum geophilum 1.58]|uniref:uncharacterized protein n=1 Tax=Cenococcum geophilum 1.58 TaxID=794803 RepID=UPI00358F5AB6|nr:hypothetical protein K441DRAFT_251192 [Cenococcum geophilum 1.58]